MEHKLSRSILCESYTVDMETGQEGVVVSKG